MSGLDLESGGSRFSTGVPAGTGATAEIFRSYDHRLKRQVAFKYPRSTDKSHTERLVREARALAKIRHPGICEIYDAGVKEGRTFIVMQWIEGPDIVAALRHKPINQAVSAMVNICDAVAAAHSAGVVHRDLKPDNILTRIDEDGALHPVVLDFGLALDIHEQRITREGQPLGTPAFMAPEQIRGQGQVDEKSDVYGLGATFFCILTGRPPFDGDSAAETMVAALESEPPSLRAFRPNLSKSLDAIVLKCLEREPTRRYPSVSELAEDLRRFLDDRPVKASGISRFRRFVSLVRRFPRATATMVLTATAAATMLIVATAEQRRDAQLREQLLQTSQELEWSWRAEKMSPRHDLTTGLERIRSYISEVEKQLPGFDADILGPAHFALGRSYLALAQLRDARHHLEAAWQHKFHDPKVAYFLGLTLSRIFDVSMAQSSFGTADGQELRRIALEAQLLKPAARYLQAAEPDPNLPTDYLSGLLKLSQGNKKEAFRDLESAVRKHPWLYESQVAYARATFRQAFERTSLSAWSEAVEIAESVLELLDDISTAAPSDPDVANLGCSVATSVLQWAGQGARDLQPRHLNEVESRCSAALELAPNEAPTLWTVAQGRLALIYHQWSADNSANVEDDLAQSLAEAERLTSAALEKSPRPDPAWLTAIDLALYRGSTTMVENTRKAFAPSPDVARRVDPTPYVEQSGELLRQLMIRRTVDSTVLLPRIAQNFEILLRADAQTWSLSRSKHQKAIRLLEQASNLWADFDMAHHAEGRAHLLLASQLRRTGLDTRETLEAARRAYGVALQLNPRLLASMRDLALVETEDMMRSCAAGADPAAAAESGRAWLRKALEIEPKDVLTHSRIVTWHTAHVYCAPKDISVRRRALAELRTAMENLETVGGPRWPLPVQKLEFDTLVLQESLVSGGVLPRNLADALHRSAHVVSLELGINANQQWRALEHLLWRAEVLRAQARDPEAALSRGQYLLDHLAAVDDGRLLGHPRLQAHTLLIQFLGSEELRRDPDARNEIIQELLELQDRNEQGDFRIRIATWIAYLEDWNLK